MRHISSLFIKEVYTTVYERIPKSQNYYLLLLLFPMHKVELQTVEKEKLKRKILNDFRYLQ